MILILILTFTTLQAETYSVRVGKKVTDVKAKEIRGVDHFSHYQIQKYILKNTKHNSKEDKFESKEFNLNYQNGSFFLVHENWSGKNAAQLNLPVSVERGVAYFPAVSFLRSLDTLGIYTVSFSSDMKHVVLVGGEDMISIRSLPQLPTYGKATKVGEKVSFGNSMSYRSQDPFRSSFRKLNKELLKGLKEMEPEDLQVSDRAPAEIPQENIIPQKSKKESVNPTNYVIPKGLIRKELEEIENK